MSKRDYYEVLGVTRTCTEVELKTAFRKAAMQHHPDRNPGDTGSNGVQGHRTDWSEGRGGACR